MFDDESTSLLGGLEVPVSEVISGEQVDREWRVGHKVFNLDALSALLLLDLGEYLPAVMPEEYSPIEVSAFAARALQISLLKKYEFDCNERANAAALDKFLQVNKACGEWSLSCKDGKDDLLINQLRKELDRFFYPSGVKVSAANEISGGDCVLHSYEQFLAHGKCGPGASLGAKANDFYTKLFAGPLSYTAEHLYRSYRAYTERFDSWRDAENYRYSTQGADDQVVRGNVLSFVPKNVDISRCICIEPSLNMFYQLGVKQVLERRLKQVFGLDISRPQGANEAYSTVQQERNRDLAQLASMFDGQWATIDLSSASDSLSLEMMRTVFPKEPLAFLETLRSRTMALPDGSELELQMISTMGNGFTFPLQTLLFSCIVSASSRVAGYPLVCPWGKTLGNFGVYGDDIVCRTEVLPNVLRLLELLGFVVNTEKSFVKGPFRESCGGDFFMGHLVRGVYLKRLRTQQDFYVAINSLNRWTMVHGIPIPLATAYLQYFLKVPNLVPYCEGDDAGLKVPHKWISFLKRDQHVQAVKYRRDVVEPSRLSITMCGVYSSDLREARMFNPHGLWTSFLAGYVSGSGIGLRLKTKRYRREMTVVPYWDYWPTFAGIAPADCVMSLEDSIDTNSRYWLHAA